MFGGVRTGTPASRGAAFAVLVLAAGAHIAGGGTAAAAQRAPAPGGDGPGEALQRVLDEAVQQGAPGALAQSRTPRRVRNLSSGVADRTTGRPPRADMRFRIGSITKTFVSTVILQLVAEGRLRLGDTVDRVIPGVVQGNGYRGDEITVRMLLDHTSGIADYTRNPRIEEIAVTDPRHDFTLRELAEAGLEYPPDFPPGTSWRYSDTDYVLLGMIIECLTGRTYTHEITRRIIRPLRLRGTYFPGADPRIRGPHLHAYTPVDGDPARLADTTEVNTTFARASGDLISTVGDLNRFDSALLGGRLLPGRLLRAMLRPVPGSRPYPGSDMFRYGLGVVIAAPPCGVRVYGNGGTLDGWETWTGGTRDGRHTMSFVLTTDAVDQVRLTAQAVTAEYCTTSRHRTA
ncbi:class A beta-lactamase-related serine hydrolase [Actinomadura bangladeshensis]|uniref:Class A beta-lactamase-related serine hydrolase n=2 Tax=Actinomadura bangladeshensis TaxID=453573 RepID=A0A4R4PCP7_9ACTN|nr:class A beta-lactamase-related serine hydrolase [Actinomadura bangladeshensis]